MAPRMVQLQTWMEFHIEYSICQCDDYGFLRRLYVPDREGTARQKSVGHPERGYQDTGRNRCRRFWYTEESQPDRFGIYGNAEDLLSRPVSNVSQALQGLVPGMNFSYASDGNGGEIGADMKVNIRGAGTIGDGSNASPLILIDGMEGNMIC